jgi:hypothetical protein
MRTKLPRRPLHQSATYSNKLIILETLCATLSSLDVFERAIQKENKYECWIHVITKEKFLTTNNVFSSMNSLHI